MGSLEKHIYINHTISTPSCDQFWMTNIAPRPFEKQDTDSFSQPAKFHSWFVPDACWKRQTFCFLFAYHVPAACEVWHMSFLWGKVVSSRREEECAGSSTSTPQQIVHPNLLPPVEELEHALLNVFLSYSMCGSSPGHRRRMSNVGVVLLSVVVLLLWLVTSVSENCSVSVLCVFQLFLSPLS